MAVPTNTTTEHAVIGTKEDLQDIIYDISPTDTPFMNGIGKATASQVNHEWQTDALAAAAANAQIEGDDAAALAFSPTARIGNYCQIARKTVQVSGTSQASDQAGRANELSYQISKRGKELKRDLEFSLTQNAPSAAGNSSTARTSAGVEAWLTTNVDSGSGYADGGFSSGIVGAATDGTQRAFTKAQLDNVIQQAWNNGGDPTVIMVGPHNRTVVSGFSGISQLQTNANPGGEVTLMGSIDLYKSDFGTLKVVPNRFQRERTALILDMDMWSVAYLRPMQMEELAKTGDSDKRMMLCEFTLVCKNELSSGKIADLTTS